MNFDFTEEYESNESIDINRDNDIDILNIPATWSAICFHETINYYTDCNTKTMHTQINLD